MDTVKLIETRMKAIEAQRDALMHDPEITRYLNAVDEYVQKTQDREMNIHERRNVAQCLQNAIDESGLRQSNRLFEATEEHDISFLGIQLPVIAALLPSLALNEIAIVQALDRRIAAVFFLDVKYGTTKGGVAADTDMITALTGHEASKAGRRYAMARVVDEVLTGNANGGNGDCDGTVAMAAEVASLINLENVRIEAVIDEVRVTLGLGNEAGTIRAGSATQKATGSITAAGLYDITVTGFDSDVGEAILITYDYQYDLPEDDSGNKTGVPEVNIAVRQETVEAMDFPLRAKYSVGASIDLQKAHGINLEDELVKYLGNEVKFTIDQVGLDMIDKAAKDGTDVVDKAGAWSHLSPALPPTPWDARIASGQEWLWKKHELMDRFEQGSNNIFKKTKRGVATFIHCGNNVARVIRQLPDFKPSGGGGTPPTGPMKIGELLGRTVIQNPFKNDNKYTLGFRGDHYLYAGFIYCPYIPLFATPTLITSDLMAQKGFLSSAGFKVINPGLFCEGTISHLGETTYASDSKAS